MRKIEPATAIKVGMKLVAIANALHSDPCEPLRKPIAK
jgi:hypothetical protein